MNQKNKGVILAVIRIIQKVLLRRRCPRDLEGFSRAFERIKELCKVIGVRALNFGIPVGAVLGTVACLVGIGGGIWLYPLLILSGLADPKRATVAASIFILTNSISGFLGHSISKPIDLSLLVPLAFVVLAGGFIGSRFGAFKFVHDKIRIIVGALVAFAGISLTLKLLV